MVENLAFAVKNVEKEGNKAVSIALMKQQSMNYGSGGENPAYTRSPTRLGDNSSPMLQNAHSMSVYDQTKMDFPCKLLCSNFIAPMDKFTSGGGGGDIAR